MIDFPVAPRELVFRNDEYEFLGHWFDIRSIGECVCLKWEGVS